MVLGDHDRTTTGEGILPEKTVNVSAIHIHRDHERHYRDDNDIAVLELAEEVDLNIYTPACMAEVWTPGLCNILYIVSSIRVRTQRHSMGRLRKRTAGAILSMVTGMVPTSCKRSA